MGVSVSLEELEVEVEINFKKNGKRILNSKLYRLLKIVDEKGSLLAACRETGIPYSRAWDWIAKVERELGTKIVETKRGGVKGGGMKLTNIGKELLNRYEITARKYGFSPKGVVIGVKMPELSVMGSHDPLLELIVKRIKNRGVEDVEISWIGSAGGLASLMIGDADIAGIHLLEPETGEYNLPYLDRYWLKNRVVVYRGYMREIGLVYRRELSVRSFREIVDKKLRFVNRILGSGTRILINYLVEKELGPRGGELINGYDWEVRTHLDVCRAIAERKADVGVALKYCADLYGLGFTRLKWEWYDFAISKASLKKKSVKEFIYIIREELKDIVSGVNGYKVAGESGEVLEY
ncbi:MAG: hypothetical protein DRJ37_07380 [Thermoprotei archaeon]|nr:MAG: hypothetical protein DRJ37_07380 [Thermoprotei archaeon]